MENREDLLPYNRNYYILGGCLTLIFTFIIISLVLQNLQRTEEQKPIIQDISIVPETNNNIENVLTKYNQDSDQDGIPNFIEDESGLDKFKSEYFFCESTIQKCNSPLNSEKYYFTILIDSSTSMNFPADRVKSKIEAVKIELSKFLDLNEINSSYISTSVRSFGNTGMFGNIPDAESCVSGIKIKDFEQKLPLDKDRKPSALPLFSSYNANGISPIIYAIEQSERDFPDPSAQNIVILITDGLDECNPTNLKNTFTSIIQRGIIKKINTISVFSSSYDEGILKDATESNTGMFREGSEISTHTQNIIRDTIVKNWCLFKDQQKINQCIVDKFDKAQNALNSKINSQINSLEAAKIREINSSINFGIQNYISNQTNIIIDEGNKSIEFRSERY